MTKDLSHPAQTPLSPKTDFFHCFVGWRVKGWLLRVSMMKGFVVGGLGGGKIKNFGCRSYLG